MSRYETEQEQIEAIKGWWAKNGTLLLSGVLIVAISFAGWRYWQSYQYAQSANASAMFEVLEMSHNNGVFGEVAREARKLIQEQPSSPYAGAASLMLAQFHWEKGESDEVINLLSSLMGSQQSNQIKQVAALRLVRVYIELKQFEQAQKTLDGLMQPGLDLVQQANIDYVKGLLAFAQAQSDTARQAFKSVVDNQQASAELRALAQLQMDDLAQ